MERLKQLREAKKMTQLSLGMQINASQETISGYEIGRAQPNLDMLVKLADALGTTTDYILGRTDSRVATQFSKSDLSDDEMELLKAVRTLPSEKRQTATELMQGLLDLIEK